MLHFVVSVNILLHSIPSYVFRVGHSFIQPHDNSDPVRLNRRSKLCALATLEHVIMFRYRGRVYVHVVCAYVLACVQSVLACAQ